MSDVKGRIEQLITKPVVLFMKGSRRLPQCGFSATVVQILDQHLDDYETVNVLADNEIREGIKTFSSWPTIPQLYVDGEFIGGCDIVKDLESRGELSKVLASHSTALEPPKLTFTDAAKKAIVDANEPGGLRFAVDPRWQYALYFDEASDADLVVEANGLKIIVDKGTARKTDGAIIDFLEGPDGPGFKIDNPNEPPTVKPISARGLKAKMDNGEAFELIDVRSPEERSMAKIEPSTLLDQESLANLEKLDHDTVMVFYCRSGARSFQAAQHFLGLGFKKVFNLAGGINAWSSDVDPSTPQY